MKPTYEQVVEWAREAGMREGDVGDWTTADAALMYPECVYTENLERFAALAYEAGCKDENEECAEMVKNWNPEFFEYMTQEYAVHFIRARRRTMDDYVIDGNLAFSSTSSALKFYREQYHKKKEWQGLTDEEIISSPYCAGESDSEVIRLARDIEAKLKEKNG